MNKCTVFAIKSFDITDNIMYNYIRSESDNRGYHKGIWGKSGLHRAGCQLTTGGGNSKESATEINRHNFVVRMSFMLVRVRMERQGKSLPAIWRHIGYANPTRSNAMGEV